MAALNESVFSLENISFSYPQGEPLLNGLTLDIRAGERVSVLGANGCGKSTLLKILAGLLLPQSGIFTAFGNPIKPGSLNGKAAAAYHRRVGYIFQDSEVQLFCSTVYDELSFGLLQLGLPGETVKNRVLELSSQLGLDKLLDKPPFRLSGGEKKKVAVACVLIMNPEVLILDEPTNSLDPRSQAWLLHLLGALGKAGKTLIFATHNLELVPHITDRAVLFAEDHRVAADTTVRDLFAKTELLKSVNLVDEHFHTHPWDFEKAGEEP